MSSPSLVNKYGALLTPLQVGGYLSIKRNTMSIPAPFSVTQEQLTPFTEALLKVGGVLGCVALLSK